MLHRKIGYTLFGVVLLGVMASSSVGAVPNAMRTTYFTFSRSVQLPSVALPAGTYIFDVLNPDTGADVVRVRSRDRSKLYLLRLTRAVERPRRGDMKAAIVLGEQPAGSPPIVKSWFPEGNTIGREFIY